MTPRKIPTKRSVNCLCMFISALLAVGAVAQDDTGWWVATPVGSLGPDVWVDITMEPDFLWVCDGECRIVEIRLIVSPCPVGARFYPYGQPDPVEVRFDCIDEIAVFDILALDFPDPRLDLLLAPGSYVLDGQSWVVGLIPQFEKPCEDVHCSDSFHYGPTNYTTDPVATGITTWGRIKALYR
jgi:hypothetical protein